MADIDTVVASTKRLDIEDNDDLDQQDASSEHSSEDAEPNPSADGTAAGDDENHSGPLHPLEYEWTFWYDKRPATGKRMKGEQESYENNLRPIGTFSTVSLTTFTLTACNNNHYLFDLNLGRGFLAVMIIDCLFGDTYLLQIL